jgi:hypothetical protein
MPANTAARVAWTRTSERLPGSTLTQQAAPSANLPMTVSSSLLWQSARRHAEIRVFLRPV